MIKPDPEIIKMTKYIVVTGGVISSLGKGITCSSIALLMIKRGLKATVIKMDPYINPDAGLLGPYEHGEVFVTHDGGETDLDLGNYERFLGQDLSKENNITTGKVYMDVIAKERRGGYLGKTVQVIPHITDNIKERIFKIGKDFDMVIIEVGGVIGDIENIPFIEALRQIYISNKHSMIFIHLALLPYLPHIKENKTKPVQHSVKEMLRKGIQPDIIICRTQQEIDFSIIRKVAMFCNVSVDDVFVSKDSPSKYLVPKDLLRQGLDKRILGALSFINYSKTDFKEWDLLIDYVKKAKLEMPKVRLGVIKKYENHDNYASLSEALFAAGFKSEVNLEIVEISSEVEDMEKVLKESNLNGILIPGGFGVRGTEGKMKAIAYARTNNLPFLGICLGFQLAAIEFSKNVLGLKDSVSTEFVKDKTAPKDPKIPPLLSKIKKLQDFKSQTEIQDLQSSDENSKIQMINDLENLDKNKQHRIIIDLYTLLKEEPTDPSRLMVSSKLRLGTRKVRLLHNTDAYKLYDSNEYIEERFRHRYTFNPNYIKIFEKEGLIFSGFGPEENTIITDVLEIPELDFFVGVQFHPEYRSKIFEPHPLFCGLVGSMKKQQLAKEE